MILATLNNAWFKTKRDVFDFYPQLKTPEVRAAQERARKKKAELEAHYRWALQHDPETKALAAQLEARRHGRPPGTDGGRDGRQPEP